MDGDKRQEVEIKLPFRSAAEALEALRTIGAREVRPRRFEDNLVLDRKEDPLEPAGKLLRLRRYGRDAFLTYKAPVPGDHRHKVREEHETRLDDFEAMRRILEHLGFDTCYRYQKYRTLLALGGLHVCLDETPIGCFVELEGPPAEIDRVAGELGMTPEHYVLETYRELHEKLTRHRGDDPGDLVFDGGAEGPR